MRNYRKTNELLEILSHGGTHDKFTLAKELGYTNPNQVNTLICQLRRRVLAGENIPYPYTNGKGWTIETDVQAVTYEATMRMRQGYGVLLNGIPVFRKCKVLAPKALKSMTIAFKPKMITFEKEFIK